MGKGLPAIMGVIVIAVIVLALIVPNGAELLANFFMSVLAVVAGTGLFIILKSVFEDKE